MTKVLINFEMFQFSFHEQWILFFRLKSAHSILLDLISEKINIRFKYLKHEAINSMLKLNFLKH